MEGLTFQVQGSAPEPYTVAFHKDGRKLTARCTCPAGAIGQNCKHRLRILGGSDEGIVSGNEENVAKLLTWLSGSDVEAAMLELNAAEGRLAKAKAEVSDLKKRLAKTLQV